MAAKKGNGLLMVYSDVAAEHDEEYNRWYNEEHIYERLSVPGILSAARYEAVVNGPKHLAVYELESVEVLQSAEYLELKSNPSEWSRKMSPDVIASRYIRNVYEQIFPDAVDAVTSTSGLAPAL